MDRIQQLLSENRWEDAGVLLNRHPRLFLDHPGITLTLHRLDERHLEDLLLSLRPEVRLPSVRLERMNLQRGQPPKGHASTPLLDLHMVWHGDWAPPRNNALADKTLKQERETVMAIPSLRDLKLSRPDGSDMSPHVRKPDGTQKTGYVTTWARVLNAQLIAQAQVHFLKRFSMPGGTVSLHRDLTPTLLALPPQPHASVKPRDLHSLTLLNRESYNTWVESVETARTDMRPYFSRFAPKLTRLPTDNG